ncbi:hypothetical protein NUU61_007910 [Penicillium alfredii]|uniref:L-ornithine N(5)-oxygenase n=1 Tax=Penicillium alfredii TaxID=1506179 RepID=A0A9W9ERD7_9EURO|nr:uncharacterized protein NUU61_007910 [Penicillium alfredii]KAJ5086603.1 hypothetical protein NUU61_007910 [Penicillium alfredii]
MVSPGSEILDYLVGVAEKYHVNKHFVGGTVWQGARWQDSTHTWQVQLQDILTGQLFTRECCVLISAVGGLVDPHPFRVPGIETFSGDIMHTARWKQEVNVDAKKVAVIGNGASASQLVSAIAEKTHSVTQLMRTPHHIMPSWNLRISSTYQTLLRYIPGLLFLLRILLVGYMETSFRQFDARESRVPERMRSVASSYEHIQKNAPSKETPLGRMRISSTDKATSLAKYWNLLLPTYEFGCKRRIFDRHYISTLRRSNVHLVDDRVTAIEGKDILTRTGMRFEADVLILATGFSLTQYDIPLIGRHGKPLQSHWDACGNKSVYKSVAMHGFPNFFFVLGPNSGRANTSTILSIESFVELIIAAVGPVFRGEHTSVEVQLESEKMYNDNLRSSLRHSVQDNSCASVGLEAVDPSSSEAGSPRVLRYFGG